MEGVLEPLLGVSDTGDTQMMYPGKNYTFEGTKVVEYPREYFTATDTLNDEIPVAQKGIKQASSKTSGPSKPTERQPIYVTDPADPRLHSYLDSLNLNKAYLAQRRINPQVDLRQYITKELGRLFADEPEKLKKYIAREEGWYKKYKSSSKDEQAKFFKPGRTKDAWKSEKKFKEDVPEDSPLIDAYKALTFSSPTETGLWTTPDLYNENIAPVDIYFGGKKNAAYNPVFAAPVQPVEYRGEPTDYMQYRSSPTIYGSKYKFNPKLKLTQQPEVKPVKKEQPVSTTTPTTAKTPVKSAPQTVSSLSMFGNPNVELLVDNFGNYEWFRKDDPGDMVPIRSATREEIEYSKKQKQRNGGVSVNKADEYPLEKLDNLLNFTNYNKPTAKNGKWLDKYK